MCPSSTTGGGWIGGRIEGSEILRRARYARRGGKRGCPGRSRTFSEDHPRTRHGPQARPRRFINGRRSHRNSLARAAAPARSPSPSTPSKNSTELVTRARTATAKAVNKCRTVRRSPHAPPLPGNNIRRERRICIRIRARAAASGVGMRCVGVHKDKVGARCSEARATHIRA